MSKRTYVILGGYMKRQTFERALHAWDKWHESIEKSRIGLGYNPQWEKETCLEWIEDHKKEINDKSKSELERLQLPPTLYSYWIDCFYCDYRIGGEKSDFSKITGGLSEHKSLPKLPYESSMIWYGNEDIHDPWIRLEIRIHSRFVTQELLKYATDNAQKIIQNHLRREGVEPHPVCEWLKGGRPLADEQLALECVHLKDDLKWTYKEIAEHQGWPLQNDCYGNPNQCSSARRYVRIGRKLRSNINQ